VPADDEVICGDWGIHQTEKGGVDPSSPIGSGLPSFFCNDRISTLHNLMKTLFGGTRIVDMLGGEQLPRIC
jgi:hypothetical protein